MTTYKNIGATTFRGAAPGAEFDADLTEDEERRAKQRGQIKVVRRHNDKPDQEEEVQVDA